MKRLAPQCDHPTILHAFPAGFGALLGGDGSPFVGSDGKLPPPPAPVAPAETLTAMGDSLLTGALKSDDTAYMAQALGQMGVAIEEPDATSFRVHGHGRLQAPAAPLFLGNAGTATRFLTAAAALVHGTVVLDGDDHMRTRPIAPLVHALTALGVRATAPSGCPPVRIEGEGRLRPGRVSIDSRLSSQYVSALLMLAACGEGAVEVALQGGEIGARGYVELTLSAMRRFGAMPQPVGESAWRVPPTGYRAADVPIEPDASAATYLWAAARLTGGVVELGVAPADFTQPDAAAWRFIERFPEMPARIDGAQMQDAVPTLAVLAAFNRHPVRFTGIANLRVKECDRVRALATELCRIRPGLAREEGDDLLVAADPSLAGAFLPTRIETYDDHRIAMSFALAGLKLGGITIQGADCVGKTYPGYWDALASLGVSIEAAA